MASRKNLKKAIKNICGELLADCVALRMVDQANTDVLDGLMVNILNLNNEFVARINHTEKGSERTFYKKLREEFTDQVNAIAEDIAKA